ncbi:hypothetical protein ACH4N9_26880, partial [Streptomyces luteogriseus]|uniref:hypothetical protein n=1 Tax=Streptomyces luteogriseus TaxID=68233 RepID=UPI00378A7697
MSAVALPARLVLTTLERTAAAVVVTTARGALVTRGTEAGTVTLTVTVERAVTATVPTALVPALEGTGRTVITAEATTTVVVTTLEPTTTTVITTLERTPTTVITTV